MELEVYSSDGQLATTFSYQGERCSIGRGRLNDVTVNDRTLARRHAGLTVEGDGVFITDLSSRQGLWLDGERVRHWGPLSGGDVIYLGSCQLRVRSGMSAGHDAAASRDESVPGRQKEAPPEPEPTAASEAEGDASHKELVAATSGPTSEELVELYSAFQEQIAEVMNLYRRDIIDELTGDRLREEAERAARQVLDEGLVTVPEGVDTESLIETVIAEAVGLGPLEPLLAEESVTEVMVNGPSQVYVERSGRIEESSLRFTSETSLMRIIDRIVTPVGRRIDEGSPLVDARLPDGSRVNVIIPPLSLVGPVITIRKFAKKKFTLDELVEIGSLNESMAQFLRVCVQYRKNVVISGGTGTGKTTFLNAMSEDIPNRERIITIEDSAEIQLNQEHVIPLESRPANIEGTGEIPIRTLVRNSLRMRPDRIVVGECRGAEALDMLQAMNTGHDGSLTTAHANSPRDAISRMEVMTLMAGMELPVHAIREQVASAVDIIVQLTRFQDGGRRVTSISEVNGMEGDTILTQELFRFRQSGLTADGTVLGEYEAVGGIPSFYEDLRQGGVDVDLSIFHENVASE